jgi:hypothetical protein
MTRWLTAIPLRPKLAIAHGDKANVRGRCSGRQIICFGAVLPALCPSVRVSRLPIELQQLDLPLTVASHQSQGVLYELCFVKMPRGDFDIEINNVPIIRRAENRT